MMKLANGPTPYDDQVSAAALRERALPPFYTESMPPNAVPFYVEGSAASPAYGAANQIVIASFQCPSNFLAVLKGILATFDGAFVPGSGNILWTLDVDIALPAVTGQAGYQFDGYGNMKFPKGSYASGLWRIEQALRFKDGETCRLKVQTVAVVGQGAPNFTSGALAGWIVPLHLARGY